MANLQPVLSTCASFTGGNLPLQCIEIIQVSMGGTTNNIHCLFADLAEETVPIRKHPQQRQLLMGAEEGSHGNANNAGVASSIVVRHIVSLVSDLK